MEYLPHEVKDGLNAARRNAQRRKGRMRIDVGGQEFTILRYWNEGFALDAADAPHMRGHVDLYDGSRLMGRCLVMASGLDDGEMVYEFKQMTPASDRAPLDFAPEEGTAAALIGYEAAR